MPEFRAATHEDAVPTGRDIYTVSRLNREVKRLLDRGLGVLWVEGELSNLARPGSGHWYFSLKDAGAQVRCAMFRGRNRLVGTVPANGDQVLVRGRVGLYEPRGEYQMVIDHLEPAGEGALRLALEQLKKQLDGEGLFDTRHKRPVPTLPSRIGVVTSPTGAAVRDVLKVLKRRFPAIPVVIYPVPVQGAGAAAEIARALDLAGRRGECDVLILTRGGGSLEDLWAFNEAVLARAIFDCPIPVVCGVGHEVDVTIADLVADLRAPTPSAAAEQTVPDRTDWLRSLEMLVRRLRNAATRSLSLPSDRLAQLARRLKQLHPVSQVQQHGQRVDELVQRLTLAQKHFLRDRTARLAEQTARLVRGSPLRRIQHLATRAETLRVEIVSTMLRQLEARKTRLAVLAGTLNAVSPLGTLERGYAILRRPRTREIVRRAGQVRRGEPLTATLAHGELDLEVTGIRKDGGIK